MASILEQSIEWTTSMQETFIAALGKHPSKWIANKTGLSKKEIESFLTHPREEIAYETFLKLYKLPEFQEKFDLIETLEKNYLNKSAFFYDLLSELDEEDIEAMFEVVVAKRNSNRTG